MESKLTTMGHSFFQAMGPNAHTMIEAITSGMLNLSAATGKSASMLLRSLEPQLVNTPLKAIGSLDKYGVANKQLDGEIKALGATTNKQIQDLVKSGAVTQGYADYVKGLTAVQKTQNATQLETNALTTKYNGVAAKTETASEKLANVWNQLQLVAGKFVNKGMEAIVRIMPKIIKWFQQVWVKVQPVVQIFGHALSDAVKRVWIIFEKNLLPSLKHLWTSIAPVVKIVGLLVGALLWLAIKALPIVARVLAGVINILADVFTVIGKVVSFVQHKVAPAFMHAFSSVVNAVRTALNFIIGIWDATIGAIAHGQSMGVGPFHATMPNLYVNPLAQGGVVTRPTLALVGERGPEAVVPLGHGGFGNVTVNVYGSVMTEHDLAEKLQRAFLKTKRRSGALGLA